ncbi:putative xyloglucan endotransglucosylase/hydrolase protein 30 [Tasmannia lanceolata]|uniref:putative xyloglucan endotransglucosylase/hydrolase protein 30 n=1 Tax=Tasmannia lanceolata TaxID=3420 RepID=UPI004062C7DE
MKRTKKKEELKMGSFALSLLVSLSLLATLSVAFKIPPLSFKDGYMPLFGNLIHSPDDKTVSLHLDKTSGSGFNSSNLYKYGLFSASIKLPSDYTAGVVVAFYASNGDIYEKTHDELDFEFLGNIKGEQWLFQTNVYGNGSTSRGREERYVMSFDPTKDFHSYSILWTQKNIIFYVDDVPIREVIRSDAMGGDYPSKPMALYATIWDGSDWATSGGKYKVDYQYAPFVTEFTNLVLKGCAVDPIKQLPSANCAAADAELSGADYAVVKPDRRSAMQNFRHKYMTYSYCYDTKRYPVPMPECVIIPSEKSHFSDTGNVKFGGHQRLARLKRRSLGSRGDEF